MSYIAPDLGIDVANIPVRRFPGSVKGGYSSINIDCHKCHARYHMDPALFKGAKGMRVRCRRCGNSLDVLNPGKIASDRNVVQEQLTPPEMGHTLPAGEPVPLSQEDGEKEESLEEFWSKPLLVSANAHAPPMFSPPFPNIPEKAHSRPTFRWSSLIALCLFLLLVAGGSAYLIFTPAGKGILAGIGQDLANAVTFFRS